MIFRIRMFWVLDLQIATYSGSSVISDPAMLTIVFCLPSLARALAVACAIYIPDRLRGRQHS